MLPGAEFVEFGRPGPGVAPIELGDDDIGRGRIVCVAGMGIGEPPIVLCEPLPIEPCDPLPIELCPPIAPDIRALPPPATAVARQTYMPAPLPYCAEPLTKYAFAAFMYHTTGPAAAEQCGIIMPDMVLDAAGATDIEPSANAAPAMLLTRIRMNTAFRERARAKRRAHARYCRLEVTRRTLSRAHSTAAASVAPSPLASARDTSGNATLA
jgi:hypothetical protein